MENNSERTPYHFGYRVSKSEEYPYGWKVIDTKDINTKRPVVLCFGGNATINTTYANGMAKHAERFLGVTPENKFIDVYSIQYGGREGYETGNLTPDEITEITKKLFLPLIIGKDNKRLETEIAAKNMRNINILSYCYGEYAINKMVNYTAQVMTKFFDYSEEETTKILSQILQVSYAPIVEPNKYTTNFEFRSLLDEQSARRYEKEYLEQTKQEEIPFIGCGEMHIKNNTVKFYAKSYDYETKTTMDEHDIMIHRDENWNALNKRADVASQSLACILAMGVLNSKENQKNANLIPLPSAKEIADLIQPTLDKENNSYFEQQERDNFEKQKNNNLPQM